MLTQSNKHLFPAEQYDIQQVTATRATLKPSLAASSIESTFSILAFSAVFLQKIGFSFSGSSIGLNTFLLVGGVTRLFVTGQAVIDRRRAYLFAGLFFSIVLSVFVGAGETKSIPAIVIVLVMYGTLLFRVDVDRVVLLRCLSKYQTFMTLVACIVIGQQIVQYTVGAAYWPNMDRIVPGALLLDGYAYIRPYSWNSPYLTPNGIFFLEPSAVASFLAFAVAVELIWFKRIKHMLLLLGAVVIGMAGSGVTILALFSPLLALKMNRRMLQYSFFIGIPLLLIAVSGGFLDHFMDRSSEFSDDKSSAHARMVIPFQSTVELGTDPQFFLTGKGAGSSPKGNDQVQWPANKLILEYGLLTAFLFHLFILEAMLSSPASRTLALMVLVPHLLFGGGFVSHNNIMSLVMFGSLLRLKPKA